MPLKGVRENPEHLAMLEAWLRSYRPEVRFDEAGRLTPELAAEALRVEAREDLEIAANVRRLLAR